MIHILMGPSGCGKTSLSHYLKEMGMPELVSHTTRPMRVNEIDGIHYHFVTSEQFNQIPMIESTLYSDHHYGVSQQEVVTKLKTYPHVFAVLDVQGVRAMKEKFPNQTRVYFVQTDIQVLASRMKQRGDNLESIQKRLDYLTSNREWEHLQEADYIISNDGTLEEAWLQLKHHLIS